MSGKLTGGCLCGTVRYSASSPQVVGHCHCVDCRKSSGTGHCTHAALSKDDFELSGDVKFYDYPADSGNIVSRGFCPTCGAPIFSKNSGMPGMVFLRASSLDDSNAVTPQMVVYASRAPTWDHMDPSLPRFATMPQGGPHAAMQRASD
jgi:hypothetical protein